MLYCVGGEMETAGSVGRGERSVAALPRLCTAARAPAYVQQQSRSSCATKLGALRLRLLTPGWVGNCALRMLSADKGG